MIDICPTILAADVRTYRVQMEQVVDFTRRIHIDLADGILAPTKLLSPKHLWWPAGMRADLHVMYQQPLKHLEVLISLKPQLVIVHAEADGNFLELAERLKSQHIKVGVAILPSTPVIAIAPAMHHIDHVLIFSGKIGYFGGHADLKLLHKVRELRALKPTIEIGWDGGITDKNATSLADSGIDVLNAGGFIHGSLHPDQAYATLQAIVNQGGR